MTQKLSRNQQKTFDNLVPGEWVSLKTLHACPATLEALVRKGLVKKATEIANHQMVVYYARKTQAELDARRSISIGKE